MSSDMALRFSGLLKVMTPTPSATVCRILPSAKDLSVAFGIFSIGALSLIGVSCTWIEELPRCLGNGRALPLPLWERVGARGPHGQSRCRNPSPGSHLSMRSDLSHK